MNYRPIYLEFGFPVLYSKHLIWILHILMKKNKYELLKVYFGQKLRLHGLSFSGPIISALGDCTYTSQEHCHFSSLLYTIPPSHKNNIDFSFYVVPKSWFKFLFNILFSTYTHLKKIDASLTIVYRYSVAD